MGSFDDLIEDIGGGDWSTDGFGIDSCLVHNECGTVIEQDCPECPVCGTENPMCKLGLI